MDGIKLKGREGDGFYSEVYIYIYRSVVDYHFVKSFYLENFNTIFFIFVIT